MDRSKNWTLTLYLDKAPEGTTWQEYLQHLVDEDKLRFAAYGLEHCPTTGREHLQAYCSYKNQVRFSTVKKMFPKVHIEKMIKDLKTNEKYCSKEGELVKIGDEPRENGQRNVMMEVRNEIEQNGTRPMKIARTTNSEAVLGTVARYSRFWKEMHAEGDWERRCAEGFKMPKIYIRYGSPGAGKSKHVWESIGYNIAGTDMFKSWCPNGEYYNGYNGQPHLFFEDVKKDQRLPCLAAFKDICDGYPLRLNIKFGEPVVLRATHIWITSNTHPSEWYASTNPLDYEALKRRFTRVEYINDQGEVTVEIDNDAGNQAQAQHEHDNVRPEEAGPIQELQEAQD